MKKYSAYKGSGIEWIGEIPEHWEIQKLKYIASVNLSNVDKKSFEGEQKVRLCNYLDVYNNNYITPDLNFMEATATTEQINKFMLKKGDVLITKDSEEWSDIAVPAYVTADIENTLCGYHLAHIRSKDRDIKGNYLFYAFRSNNLNHQFTISANGITRYGIGKYDIENSLFILPDLLEQQSIANFLDRKTSQIDTLIEKKKRQIELLKEQRQAVINQAVTKGLNPDVAMKDSGIEWLGKIPKHWQTPKFKYVCSLIKDGTHLPPLRQSEGIPLLSVRNIINGRFVNLPDDSLISEDDYISLTKSFQVKQQDVLLAIVGATLGKVAIVEEMERFTIQRSLAVFRPIPNILNFNYLAYFMGSETFQKLLWQNVGYSAQPGIYLTDLSNFNLTVPSLDEQMTIVRELEIIERELVTTINKAEKQIQLLQEYRTALISEAVTGKIDVREEN
jgi:type I restriction enzyme, S subunit